MDWNEAKTLISTTVTVSTSLGRPGSSSREVLAVGHRCWRHAYGGEAGFLVRIGVESDETIDIPWSMLETCYADLLADGYSGTSFRRHYLKQAKVHGCHIHVVGMMFVIAGLARSDGRVAARYTVIETPFGADRRP